MTNYVPLGSYSNALGYETRLTFVAFPGIVILSLQDVFTLWYAYGDKHDKDDNNLSQQHEVYKGHPFPSLGLFESANNVLSFLSLLSFLSTCPCSIFQYSIFHSISSFRAQGSDVPPTIRHNTAIQTVE